MDQEALLEYALSKTGAYLDHPFGPDSEIVKVGGRIFAQFFCLRGTPVMTVNGSALRNQFYRSLFPQVIARGYHCPPVMQPYFNTVQLTGEVPDALLLEMLDESYAYVIEKLPKRIRRELSL